MASKRRSTIQLDDLVEMLGAYLEFMDDTQNARRGRSYALEGAVRELTQFDESGIEFVVAGSKNRLYELSLYLDDEVGVVGVCACPVGDDCKHCYAAALRVFADLHARHCDTSYYEFILPDDWLTAAPEELPQLTGNGYGALIAMTDTLAVTPAPTASHERKPWWRLFLEATDTRAANVALMSGFQERLPRLSTGYYRFPTPTFSAEANRVDILRQHDRVVAKAAAYYGMRPKPKDLELERWLQSDEAAALWETDQARAARARLMRWLEAKTPDAQALPGQLEFQWLIPTDAAGAIPVIHFSMLLSTQKLRRSPRSAQAAETLLREHESGKRPLPITQAKLLSWLIGRHRLSNLEPRQTAFPVRNVRAWLAQTEKNVRVAWQDDQPVRLDLHPARLTLAAEDGIPAWTVRLPGPSDAFAPLSSLRLLAESTSAEESASQAEVFVLLDGALHPLDTGGMPVDVLQWLVHRPQLPIDEIQATPEAAHLANLYLPYADSATTAALETEVPVEAWLEFRMSGKKALLISARARGNNREFVLAADGSWRLFHPSAEAAAADEIMAAMDSAPPAPGQDGNAGLEDHVVPQHALIVRPRRSDTGNLESWIADFPGPLSPGPPTLPLPSMRWLMAPEDLHRLLQWWVQRPPGLICYGDAAFRAMLQARQVPRYKVSVRASGMNWLNVAVSMEEELEGLSLEEATRMLASAEGDLLLMRNGGYYRRKDLEAYRDQAEMLADLGLPAQAGEQRVHAFQLTGSAGERLARADVAESDWLALREELKAVVKAFRGIPRAKLPKSLTDVLRPYQRAGVDFLAWACKTFGGAILADDMGLGKTLQVLAAMSHLRGRKPNPSLVICPASVAHNWQREAARFTPGLKTVVLEAGTERQQVLDRLGEYDLVIKNYSLARRDAEKLQAQEWLVVCVDEAQAIKNPEAAITATVKALTAQYRIALTGTPIENRLQDLWSIADFAVPGYLPSAAQVNALDADTGGSTGYRMLRARLRPVLLRRLKAEVAPELPPRIEERLDCAMTGGQRKAYMAELKRARLLLESTGDAKGKERIQILAALTRLRQLCCDPALRGLSGKGSGKSDVLMDQLTSVLDGGHKVLVFSQFVQMIKILEKRFTQAGIPFYTLTGATKKRPELIARFEEEKRPCVFLISLKAGGTGLNLTSASHVFLFDPWWNPAVEAQAIDRTHRIGQDKTVVAFRLVAEDTIEERIIELQDKKRGLVKNLLEDEAFNRTLTKDDFKFLLE